MTPKQSSGSKFLNPITNEENDEFDDLNCFVKILINSIDKEDIPNTHVLLKILSPGGVAYKFEHTYLSLMRLKEKGFKITALIDEIAASGGYMLASACDKIVASKYATIGSVGVIAQVYNWAELGKKVGIEEKTFTTGSHKNIFPSGSAYNETDVERMNESLKDVFDVFKDIVQKSRNLNDNQLEEVLKAKTFHGFEAIKYGLVDEIKLSDEYISELCPIMNTNADIDIESNIVENEIWTVTKVKKDSSYFGSVLETSLNNFINISINKFANFIEYKTNKFAGTNIKIA